ncbi:MAG: DUF2130 domain-containing protein [Atopobiaceae bacterium]|nr:DUF2130 domain-containing protein [Atopobiaceae bacterium]
MAKITCPNCGEVIEVDPSSVEDLTRQLRDELFAQDLEARLAEAGHVHEAQLEAVRTEERRLADKRLADAQAQTAKVQAQLEAAERERELAVQRQRGEAAEQLAQLKAQLATAQQQTALEVERAQAKATAEQAQLQKAIDEQRIAAQEQVAQAKEEARARQAALEEEAAGLKAQLASQEQMLKAQGEAQLLKATAKLEQSRSELESKLKVEQANSQRAQAALREEMARRETELARRGEEQIEAKNQQIEQYKAEVERLRDYHVRLSTKLIGESLEHHCENEFNRIRMQAYPRAVFEKDNEAVEGTKGDFIFRDFDEEGNELLSIMFEMKNEEELSSASSRKRNEDHFKKLDGDRNKKNCEYAVLVSTLEPDNDFYNAGIADVSWHYPKMFVVRPQCFTTIIGLLKAAALAAHPYRMQLERAKQEEIDVTKFEQKVTAIVDGIANDYALASKNYEQAEKDIDAIIAKLQHLKGQLGTAAKHFGTASKRGDKLAIKRLTWGNQTMKAAFANAEAARQAQEDVPDDPLEPLDPDEME